MLVVSGIYYLMMHESLSRPLFYGLVIIIAISSLLSTIKSAQKIYIWLDLAYQLFLQFCVAWCTTLIASSYIHRTTGAIIKASSFYSIVIVIMMLLFLLVWCNYPRRIHNLLLIPVLLFESINIRFSGIVLLEMLEYFNYQSTDTWMFFVNLAIYPLPLLSYIAAFTNKKLFWGLLMYSVTIFIAFFF